MGHQDVLFVRTRGRGTQEITAEVGAVVEHSGIRTGLCNVFCHHTSASLLITENADPTVRRDLEAWLAKHVPDGDALFEHNDEGPDDMPAHVRSVLTGSFVSIPITDGALALGTWQGIYLYEHRTSPHRRRISVTLVS